MQPWDLQCVGTESRLSKRGWPLDSRGPSDLFSAGRCLHPTLVTGYSMKPGLFHEIALGEWGEGQAKIGRDVPHV